MEAPRQAISSWAASTQILVLYLGPRSMHGSRRDFLVARARPGCAPLAGTGKRLCAAFILSRGSATQHSGGDVHGKADHHDRCPRL